MLMVLMVREVRAVRARMRAAEIPASGGPHGIGRRRAGAGAIGNQESGIG
ncbi:hypothetical protein [Actinacidiphila epipremni]|uniref:Uncharacterized protein n=1 Tax=Actinacidiphila epipremni TaxID=2053013 RepID=A0ABX0ZPW8_9ACTN|nr:hypothetical protein [Actinacidiphila epipremni]NJP43693.1 hypothetical protein [Actinacidiphila epipremni]